jgi:hypothetical protein
MVPTFSRIALGSPIETARSEKAAVLEALIEVGLRRVAELEDAD